MHRARRTLPPLPSFLPGQYDYYAPRVRFASIPRQSLVIDGGFERLLAPLVSAAVKDAGKPLPVEERADCLLFPVHELQVANITSLFPDAVVLPAEFSVFTPAQASIRCGDANIDVSIRALTPWQDRDASLCASADPEARGRDEDIVCPTDHLALYRVRRPALRAGHRPTVGHRQGPACHRERSRERRVSA